MFCMDGNNSLKRVAVSGTRTVGDTRTFTSDYFIPQAEVNRFAGEVKARQAQPHVEVPLARADRLQPDPEDGDHSEDDASSDGDPTDGAPDSACASNWKAAASDEKKRMWAIFEECGIFASACRHGFVLWIVDMIRCGEL